MRLAPERRLARYRMLAIVTTGGVAVLTVAGGAVRLTGSGLGCDDWPNCNDERFIDVSTGHAAIEQLNRLLSGLIGIPTLLLLIAAIRAGRRGAGVRWPAVGVFVSVVANGIVGGIAVQRDLHPAMVQSHFLLAMVAITFGLIAIRRGCGRSFSWGAWRTDRRQARLAAALLVLTAAALATGTVVTGTGPHAGDEEARRFGFDISNVARTHSVTVLATLAVAVAMSIVVARHGGKLREAVTSWLFVAILQGGVGYAQYFTGVPELLVGTHILGATALWVMTVRLGLATLDEASESVSGVRTTDASSVDAKGIALTEAPSA